MLAALHDPRLPQNFFVESMVTQKQTNTTTSPKPRSMRLGSLVAHFKMATREDLEYAKRVSQNENLPLGLSLVALGCCTKRDLQTLIRVQSMLMDELITESQAENAIDLLREEQRLTLHAGLSRLRWVRDLSAKSCTLGELLIGSGLLTQLKLARARTISDSTMLPLGRVLTLTGALSCSEISTALGIQSHIRLKKISREQGIEQAKLVSSRHKQLLQVRADLRTSNNSGNRPLLGELLIESGVLSAVEVVNAIEISRPDQKMLGEILCELNWLSERVLYGALALQKLAELQVITRQNAVRALRLIHTTGADVKSVLEVILPTSKRPYRREFIEQLFNFLYPEMALCRTAPLVRDQFAGGRIEADQAMILLDYCARGSMTMKRALDRLGWTVNIKVRDCVVLRK